MKTLASIGARIRVTPWDEIYVQMTEEPGNYIDDPTPFEFRVAGRLEDGQIFYGLYGPVVSGPEPSPVITWHQRVDHSTSIFRGHWFVRGGSRG